MQIHSLPLPEAVIFDFDGIIVDTEPLHYKAFQSDASSPLTLAYEPSRYGCSSRVR